MLRQIWGGGALQQAARFHVGTRRDRKVSDETFNAVRARWGEKGLLELTAVMGVYTMNATILRAMDHRAAPSARLLTPRQ